MRRRCLWNDSVWICGRRRKSNSVVVATPAQEAAIQRIILRCRVALAARSLLDKWMAKWSDIVDFEVHAVITSKEAAGRIAPRL